MSRQAPTSLLPSQAADADPAVASAWAELRHPEFLLTALVVATLPLEVSKEWLPVSWLEISRLFMVGLILVIVRSRLADVRLLPRMAIVATGAVLAVEAVSYASTRWPEGLHDAAGVAAFAAFGAAVAVTVDSRRRLAILGLVFFISVVGVAIVALAQQAFDFYIWRSDQLDVLGRRNATFRDPNITSRILVLGALAGYGLAAGLPLRRTRWLAAAVAVGLSLIALGQVTTLSRSGLALAIFMALVAIAVLRRYRRAVAVQALVYVAVLGIGLVAMPTTFTRTGGILDDAPPQVVIPPAKQPELSEAARSILALLPLDATREYLIQAGLAMFSDHPVLGVGVGGVEPLMRGAYGEYVAADYRGDNPTVLMHTEVVRVAAETGIVGLGAYLAFLVALAILVVRRFRAVARSERIAVAVIALGLLTIVLSSQLVGRFYNEPYLWLLVGILASLALRGGASAAEPDVADAAGEVPRGAS